MNMLSGKTAVITGSTRGFGLAIAKAFAREGAQVVICSRSREAVDKTLTGFKQDGVMVSGMICDIAHQSQVEALAKFTRRTYGGLDIWVNNAAISAPYGPILSIEPRVFEHVLQVNILGAYYGSIVAMKHFLEQGSGKLINISGVGDKRSVPMQAAYASSKAWLIQFTRALADEYKSSGAGVYLLNPGMMDTDLLQKVEVIRGYEHRLNKFETIISVLSQPPEVPAQKAVWLASKKTDGRTGLVVRELTIWKILRNSVYRILGLLLNRPSRPINVQITSVPSAYPPNKECRN